MSMNNEINTLKDIVIKPLIAGIKPFLVLVSIIAAVSVLIFLFYNAPFVLWIIFIVALIWAMGAMRLADNLPKKENSDSFEDDDEYDEEYDDDPL